LLSPPASSRRAGPPGCNVIQFGAMIKHEARKLPLSYEGYSCCCGLGGPSSHRVQPPGKCCRARERCYKEPSSSRYSPKLVTHKYPAWGSQMICSKRRRGSCERDGQAAECFQRTARTYRSSCRNYPSFLHKSPTPSR
ncbi:PA2GA Phospholipase, partial [Anhinga rufa]|nr:PA2GA Phospholipase [Anhinga rufa]